MHIFHIHAFKDVNVIPQHFLLFRCTGLAKKLIWVFQPTVCMKILFLTKQNQTFILFYKSEFAWFSFLSLYSLSVHHSYLLRLDHRRLPHQAVVVTVMVYNKSPPCSMSFHNFLGFFFIHNECLSHLESSKFWTSSWIQSALRV